MKNLYLFILFFAFTISFAQNDSILNRLCAIKNNGITFYNIDGYTITSQTLNQPFNEKGLKKAYRNYSIKKDEKKTKDEQLAYNNYYVTNSDKLTENLTQNNSYYFIENYGLITIIQFSSVNKKDKEFERSIVDHIMNRTIPKENFASKTIDSVNFAGRKIKLGSDCYWTNVNTVQCPYNGEMNWSVHKDLEDAKNAIEHQLEITKSRKGGKVVSEEIVSIEFEGNSTTAKKVIYDFTGVTSLLVGLSGGKTLTIYYVATKVRGNYVSCVLSFWNNDTITENGLAPLLDKVMKIE